MSSNATLCFNHPDLTVDNRLVEVVMVAPLNFSVSNKGQGFADGAIQMAFFNHVELSREDKSLLTAIADIAASVWSRDRENNELKLEVARGEVFLELAHTVFKVRRVTGLEKLRFFTNSARSGNTNP